MSAAVAKDTARQPPLMQHTVRREWGLAVMAWRRNGRVGYLFEDGVLRTFRADFATLFEKVPIRSDDTAALARRLGRQLQRARYREAGEPGPPNGDRQLRIADQLALLRHDFPGGFRDHRWLADIRGQGQQRRLKRHRAPALAAAQLQLTRRLLDDLHFDRRWKDICLAAHDVLSRTDLVPPRELAPLQQLDGSRRAAMARAVRDLLFGDPAYHERFDAFVDLWCGAVGGPPSWPLATALPALVHRHEHVCVHLPTFARQAQILRLPGPGTARPRAALYRRWLAVAEAVRQVCTDEGWPPRDLLDVHDFVRTTLAPRSRKALERIRRRRVQRTEAARLANGR